MISYLSTVKKNLPDSTFTDQTTRKHDKDLHYQTGTSDTIS
jgi:hypothetical protein